MCWIELRQLLKDNETLVELYNKVLISKKFSLIPNCSSLCFKLSSLTESYAFLKSTKQVDKNFPFSVYSFNKLNNVKIWQKFCDLFEIHPGREIKPYFFKVSFVVYYTVAQRWNLTTASHLFFKKYFSWTKNCRELFPDSYNCCELLPDSDNFWTV